jgi:hypothetical protein
VGSRRLLVSRHPESHRTLNTKVVGFGVWSLEMVQRWGRIHMNRGRVGEERGGKDMDRCPLTMPVGVQSPCEGVYLYQS